MWIRLSIRWTRASRHNYEKKIKVSMYIMGKLHFNQGNIIQTGI